MTDYCTKTELEKGLHRGFIDGTAAAKVEYIPQLLTNNAETKVLTSILAELESCDEFFLSVAFITNSGIAALVNTLVELQEKGIKGKIIASQYQDFTEPRALRRLIAFDNLDVHIQTENNFHAKGYIFRHGKEYTVLIGSSNLTANALCSNSEWNLKVSAKESGSLTHDIIEEFHRQFECSVAVTEDWIRQYEKVYSERFAARAILNERTANIQPLITPKPNLMQQEALVALDSLRAEGRNKALLISATGTGKTYLSAFDAKKVSPKKFLFVVHRENIARAAMSTFKTVFGDSVSFGFYTGREHNVDADYIFSTIQTLSKPENYERFERNHFNYIVIDEVHRAGADSYQRIIEYFKPDFLLGMSATPERTDGFDIFRAFDYNIAYEIRLHDALKQKMLSPFHYYGISDIMVEGRMLDEESDFNCLTSDERIKHIIEYTKFYGCDRGRIKGLIFCSGVEEGKLISRKLNAKGLKTVFLGGEDNEETREQAISRLETDEDDYLDYIITRDIFNEGIDIPSVNQVVMLRPTQSAIVFVQQLGRGLRKLPDKDYLTVIDFIGNYNNNFLVPIALYGDRSFNKDTIRKLVSGGSSFIPGASTINFDNISKEQIYKSINAANTNELTLLKRDYKLLKYKIGRVPKMMDFVSYGSRDPYTFILNNSCKSYYAFLCKADSELFRPLSRDLMSLLSFFSLEICNGKRIEELLILKGLLEEGSVSVDEIRNSILTLGIPFSEKSFNSAIHVLNGDFTTAQMAQTYGLFALCEIFENEIIRCTERFANCLSNEVFKSQIAETVDYAICSFKSRLDVTKYRNGFVLYEKYSRKDVCRILCWPNDNASTMYGYRIKHNTCPIFVTYKKSDDIAASTMYEDYFINQEQFHWMTRNRLTLQSDEPVQIKNYKDTGLRICLFIKQSDGESDDFYYISDVTPYDFNQVCIRNDKGEELPIVNINFNLNDRIEDNLYHYLIDSIGDEKEPKEPMNADNDNITYYSTQQESLFNDYAAQDNQNSYKH